jgi:acetyl esterase/lipase
VDYVLDPELVAVAPAIPKVGLSGLASAREAERLLVGHLPEYEAQIPLFVQDVTIPGQRSTADVPAWVYAPAERSAPSPGLLYLYGGGYVMGGSFTTDSTPSMLVERAGVIVVMVDYRLAPEHPYPAGLEDSYAVGRRQGWRVRDRPLTASECWAKALAVASQRRCRCSPATAKVPA